MLQFLRHNYMEPPKPFFLRNKWKNRHDLALASSKHPSHAAMPKHSTSLQTFQVLNHLICQLINMDGNEQSFVNHKQRRL